MSKQTTQNTMSKNQTEQKVSSFFVWMFGSCALNTVNYETRNCHCEHFAVALHRLREAIQKQGRATWIASGFALAMTIQDRVS